MNPIAVLRSVDINAAQSSVLRINRADDHVFRSGAKHADHAQIEHRVRHISRFLSVDTRGLEAGLVGI